MTKRFVVAFYVLIIVSLLSGCKKYQKEGYIPDSGIALTFDDDRIDNWYAYLPMMDSMGIKATFYISKYYSLNSVQKNKLTIIQNRGHEIAFHSVHHYNLKDYVYKSGHSFDELIKYEIQADLKCMNRDGFYPTAFAYPFGAHNQPLDALLMKHFKSVRALNGTKDLSKSIVPTKNNTVLYGMGIDANSKRSDFDVNAVLESVKSNKTCAVFVAHDINTTNSFSVNLVRLKKIANYIRENNMKFYTISEISN